MDFPDSNSRISAHLPVDRLLLQLLKAQLALTELQHVGISLHHFCCHRLPSNGETCSYLLLALYSCVPYGSYKLLSFLAGTGGSADINWSQVKMNLLLKSDEETDWAFSEGGGRSAQ